MEAGEEGPLTPRGPVRDAAPARGSLHEYLTSVRVFMKLQLQMLKDEMASRHHERQGLVRHIDAESREPTGGDGVAVPAGEDAGRLRRRIAAREVGVSLLYGANLTFSYLLMLAVMSYNVGLFATIVVGLVIGHYAFNASLPSSLDASSPGCKGSNWRHTSGSSESSDVCHTQI